MSEYNIENMQKRMKEMDQLVADNLEQVCREILEWHDTAILPDGVFRKASSLLNGLTEHQHGIVEATANRKALKFVIDNTHRRNNNEQANNNYFNPFTISSPWLCYCWSQN